MRHDLHDDPRVREIAERCSIPVAHAVGCLHAVWSWFDRHSCNGHVTHGRFTDIAALTPGVKGFAEAMEQVGYIKEFSTGISMPAFEKYHSQSAKRRALTARRVAKHRAKKCNVSVTPNGYHRREEKRRVIEHPQTPSSGKRGLKLSRAERKAEKLAAEIEAVKAERAARDKRLRKGELP